MEAFIKESKEIICKAAKNNKLVIFVGAGVSMNSGYPSWNSLIGEFAKGLGMEIKNCSMDDYLKIPQYYYNLRKEKEYYDVIFNKFDIKTEPNRIHELILDLEPIHIITTNYDELLEKASNRKGIFFDVVAKDSDLPYSVNNKMIIKMHGDLKNRNIVLKEDDYLSYFNNFQLIQNYIKSLISTHVVLFIGYSVNDINVKYIFQWVKDILKKDFQQAYFIESDVKRQFNQLEFEYYRNRGINILYTSACGNIEEFNKNGDYGNLDDDRAISTIKFLSYLLGDNENITVDKAYEKLKVLDILNVVRIEDIMNTLNLVVPWEEDGNTYYSHYKLNSGKLNIHTKKLRYLFEELKDRRLDEKSKVINRVFYSAGVKNIVDEEENIVFSVESQYEKDINEDIYLFNYRNLEMKTKVSIFDDIKGREKETLEFAYNLYKLGKYYDAYIILKRISESCMENKAYYLYFISEFNRYYLGKGISDINPFSISKLGIGFKEQEQVRCEIRKIDLNNIYINLPRRYVSHIDVYKDILTFSFIYRKINEVLVYEKKIEEEKDTIFSGIGDKKGTVYNLKEDMQYFCDFITSNRLFVEHYVEVKTSFYKFIDSILFSYSLEEKKVERNILGMSGKRVKITEIDYFTIYSVINYLNYDEIINLFDKHEIKELILEEEAIEKLSDVNHNLAYALNNIDSAIDIKNNYRKFLLVISRVNIKRESLEKIFQDFLEILEKNRQKLSEDIVNTISLVVIKQYELYPDNISIDMVQEIIGKCFSAIKSMDDESEDIKRSVQVLIYNMIYILSNYGGYISNDNEQLIVEYLKEEEITLEYYRMMTKVYGIVSKRTRNIIQKRVVSTLKNKQSFSYDEFLLYRLSLHNEIIKQGEDFEKKLIDFIDSEIYQTEEDERNGIYYGEMYTVDDLLKGIFYLLADDLILYTDSFLKYSARNEYINFILNGMNKEIFNAKWIKDFPYKLNIKLALNKDIKEKIQQYLKDNLNDKDIVEIYFKYYC